MHEDFITSSSWKNEIQGMHPDTVHESGRVPVWLYYILVTDQQGGLADPED
jgi:hypothetical protein